MTKFLNQLLLKLLPIYNDDVLQLLLQMIKGVIFESEDEDREMHFQLERLLARLLF